MSVFVVLLRGVMPVGKNKLLMAPLRAALTEAGFKGVETYIQSGNAVLASDLGRAGVEKRVHDVIESKFGPDLAVVARSPAEMRKILRDNPFPKADLSRLYFTVFAKKPSPAALKALLAEDFGLDRAKAVGATLYTLYATRSSDSKFTNNYFERRLKVACTTRNFNTMTALAALAEERTNPSTKRPSSR